MNFTIRSTPERRPRIGSKAYLVVACWLLLIPLFNTQIVWSQSRSQTNGDFLLTYTNGSTSAGKLISIDSHDRLTVQIGKSNKEFASSQILRFGNPCHSIQLDTIILQNGSRFACVVTSINPEHVEVQSRVFENTRIPINSILGIIFRQKANPTDRQQVIDLITGTPKKEFEALFQNGDIAGGQILASKSEEEIQLSFQNLNRSIPLAKLDYLHFPSKGQTAINEKEHAKIGLVDGTRLYSQKITFADSSIQIEIDSQLKLRAPRTIRKKSFFSRVCFYEPKSKSHWYLSSKQPLKTTDPPQKTLMKTSLNRSVTGGPLISKGIEYESGIGTHSGSQIVYAVGKADRLFRAKVALDDSANRLGHAICRVVVLGQDNRWTSPIKPISISRQDEPKAVEVDVSGARAIGLVASSGKNGRTGDRVNWLDARIHQ